MKRVLSNPGTRADRLLALGLGVAAQLEVWVWWVEDEQGPKPLATVTLLLMSAALLWRRRAPLPSVVAVCAVYEAWVLIDAPAGSLLPFVIVLVAVFTAAQRDAPRRALIGGAVGLAAIWLEIAVTDNDFANYAFTGFFVVAAWLSGHGFRSREERVGDLEQRAVQLEREQEEQARAAVAEERARIARELHDVVAHNVSVIVIQSQAAQQSTLPRQRGRQSASRDRVDRAGGADGDAAAARAASHGGRGAHARAAAQCAAPRAPCRQRSRRGPAR